jgi:hypothetical protein
MTTQVRAAPPGARLEGEGRGQAAELQPLRSARSRHAPACAMRQPAMRQPAEGPPRAAPTAGCSGRSHPAKRAVAGLPAAAAPIWLGPLSHPPYPPPRSNPLDHPRPCPLPLASPQVCNHPNLFEGRSIVSSLDMEPSGAQRPRARRCSPGWSRCCWWRRRGGGGGALLQVSTAAARILAALRWRWRRPLAVAAAAGDHQGLALRAANAWIKPALPAACPCRDTDVPVRSAAALRTATQQGLDGSAGPSGLGVQGGWASLPSSRWWQDFFRWALAAAVQGQGRDLLVMWATAYGARERPCRPNPALAYPIDAPGGKRWAAGSPSSCPAPPPTSPMCARAGPQGAGATCRPAAGTLQTPLPRSPPFPSCAGGVAHRLVPPGVLLRLAATALRLRQAAGDGIDASTAQVRRPLALIFTQMSQNAGRA